MHRLADGIDPAIITTAESAAGSVPGVLHAHARAVATDSAPASQAAIPARGARSGHAARGSHRVPAADTAAAYTSSSVTAAISR